MAPEKTQTAAIVLGMHRSGTSALTRMLSFLGADLPEQPLGAERGNEAGHWEPERLVELHDEMIHEAGSRWDDWRRFDPSSLGEERLAYYRGEIERLIAADYPDAPLFVLKDPRVCRFVPLFEEILAGMNIEPRYILTYRNPISVIDSLHTRDDMAYSYASMVWLRHVLDAEEYTRGKRRAFTAYEEYMDDWRPAAEKLSADLGLRWPSNIDIVGGEIDSFLSPDHRHHLAAPEDVETDDRVSPAMRDAYGALLSLSANVEDPEALEVFSRVRREFESGPSLLSGIDATFEEMARRQVRESLSREHFKRQAEEARQKFRANLPHSEIADRYSELEAELENQKKQTAALTAQRAEFKNQIEALKEDCRKLSEDRRKLSAELTVTHASASWRFTEPIRTAKRLAADPRSALDTLRNMRSKKENKTTTPTEAPLESDPNGSPETEPAVERPLPGMANLSPEEAARVREAFDDDFYLSMYPDIVEGGVDPFKHYIKFGWKEHRDPSPRFSTKYYLENSPQIAQAGVNPFIHWVVHGFREKRSTMPFERRLELLDYAPKVSVIVPNYNHDRFLEQRLDSILNQTYRNIEVLVLDDRSTDDSRTVIESYRERHPDRIRTMFNEENSGNVFRQWRKGIEHSDGELVWICESDDFCEPDFLEGLVEKLKDRSVNIAFGRIHFSDGDGNFQVGMDHYREGAEPGIWSDPVSRPARRWFTGGFGVNNVIANVGGCVFRRRFLPEEVWSEAENYYILGDWFLYVHLAGGGKISYEPSSVAYFRQHGGNTSVNAFATPVFYEEHERLMTLLRRRWDVPERTVEAFYGKIAHQYERFGLEEKLGKPLEALCDMRKLLAEERSQPHILVAFLGFHPGGGEVFPIHLANELHAQGYLVSMLALDMSEVREEMLDSLDPAIPVYDSAWVKEHGADEFFSDAGVSLIHSHMVSLEAFFFDECEITTRIPYLVTLHGSYESSTMSRERLMKIVLGVSHFVYMADKNLDPFRSLPLSESIFTKLGNAVPENTRPFPKTRHELGIAEDAVVFTLVARGIQRKGWRAAIMAFRELRDANPQSKLHLLLCGEGEETDRYLALHGGDPDITFLGYQSRIHGLYRMSDVALVPTRFAGESYPLCIIEAFQTGTPVLSTKIGEIESMVVGTEGTGGILIPYERDTSLYTEHLREAMSEMMSDAARDKYAQAAGKRGEAFKMSEVTKNYAAMYEKLLRSDNASTIDRIIGG